MARSRSQAACSGLLLMLVGLSIHDRSTLAQVAVITDARVSYTTDAFQFASARKQRFSEDPSLPTVVSLEKPEDVIWDPAVEVIRSFYSTWGSDRTIRQSSRVYLHEQSHLQPRRLSIPSQASAFFSDESVAALSVSPEFVSRAEL